MNGTIYSRISRVQKYLNHSILKIVLKTKLYLQLKNKLKTIQIYKGKFIALFKIIDLTTKNLQMFTPKNCANTTRIT